MGRDQLTADFHMALTQKTESLLVNLLKDSLTSKNVQKKNQYKEQTGEESLISSI